MDRRTTLITGGAQGIGKATARAFLQQGYGVAIVDSDAEAGTETRAEYAALGAVEFIAADVSDPVQATRAVQESVAAFGRLDVLVNNAGIFSPKPLEQVTAEAWLHILGVNLHGAFYFAQAATPHLRRTHGAIINIASTRALMSEPHTEAYSASKGGLVALTHALSVSLGPEVRVNCVSPGWIDVSQWKKRAVREETTLRDIDHRQHPAGRVGMPEDVANMVLYLASHAADFITGQNFVVDGGMTRKMIYTE